MLKIKDNVDLNVLENFDFRRCGNRYFHILNCLDDYISVIILNRHIIIGIGYKPVEDILFNLIQSGLVEKVNILKGV